MKPVLKVLAVSMLALSGALWAQEPAKAPEAAPATTAAAPAAAAPAAQPAAPAPAPAPAPARVLVVDDTPQNVKLLADILGAKGFVAITAASGERRSGSSPPSGPTSCCWT